MKLKEKISFLELKNNVDLWDTAVIVFAKESFKKDYTEEERSYKVYSNCKYFDDRMGGNSLFGYCLDGKDSGVRLDICIHQNDWKPLYCYVTKFKDK